MKLKPKGRKIYRQKTRFERLKGFFRNTGAVIGTVAGVAAIVFVGYSAGGPVIEFLEEQGILTAATSPTGEPDETDVMTTAETEASGTEADPSVQEAFVMSGYYLDAEALSTQQTLRTALASVPMGITHVIVPLKTAGGNLHYATTIADASTSRTVVAATGLSVIYETISEQGYTPVAAINAFEDPIYPEVYADAAYRIAGTQERWLDDTPENGGKPWLSPFSDLAIDYLASLTAEAAQAGFPVILCEGLTFPQFSEEDLTLLDPRAGSADRGTALVNAANAMQEAAGDAVFLAAVDGEALRSGDADLFSAGKPLLADAVLVTLTEETAADKAQITAALQDMTWIPMLPGDGSALSAAIDGSYILCPGVSAATEEETEPVSEGNGLN